MKKKLIIFISLIVCSLALLLALPACNTSSNSVLQYDKKYIYDDFVGKSGEECYYIFYSNGTGVRRYFHAYGTYCTDYRLTFKYTYIDDDKEAITCFFDSVEYGNKNDATISTDWSALLTVSKNVLCTGTSFYINEDFLNEIPNFNS